MCSCLRLCPIKANVSLGGFPRILATNAQTATSCSGHDDPAVKKPPTVFGIISAAARFAVAIDKIVAIFPSKPASLTLEKSTSVEVPSRRCT